MDSIFAPTPSGMSLLGAAGSGLQQLQQTGAGSKASALAAAFSGKASPLASALATSGSSSTSSTSTTTSSDNITANDFLTLLVTELQNQDPTQPQDPNEYIDQLVNVNSLQQLISINSGISTIDSSLTATTATGQGQTGGSGSPASQPATTLSANANDYGNNTTSPAALSITPGTEAALQSAFTPQPGTSSSSSVGAGAL